MITTSILTGGMDIVADLCISRFYPSTRWAKGIVVHRRRPPYTASFVYRSDKQNGRQLATQFFST